MLLLWERAWVPFLFQRENRGMRSFALRNTADDRVAKFIQNLSGVRQGPRCRVWVQPLWPWGKLPDGIPWKLLRLFKIFSPRRLNVAGETQFRCPKQISMKGIIYCIPSLAARDHSLSLAVPEFSMPGIRLVIVKAWQPGSMLDNNTSLHRKIRE